MGKTIEMEIQTDKNSLKTQMLNTIASCLFDL